MKKIEEVGLSEQQMFAYREFMQDCDILEKRPFECYWTNEPFQHDTEYWHSVGVRLGES